MNPGQTYEEMRRSFRWDIPEYFNIGVALCDDHAGDRDKVALIFEDDDGKTINFTFHRLKELSNRLGNALLAHGVKPGDRVGVVLSQRPETAITHLACFKIGAISLPLFTQFGPDGLQHRLDNSGAKVVVADSESYDKLLSIRDNLPNLERIILIDGAKAGGDDYWSMLEKASDRLTPVKSRAIDPAMIVYTSGTTGNPKGALHSHGMTAAHKPAIRFTHDFFPHEGDLFWTPADWAWGGGIFDCLFPSWHCGIPVLAHRFRKFDPEKAFDLLARHRVRNAFMPPTALKMMRTVQNPTARWSYAMRSIASGGEALGAEVLDWARNAFGLTINEFWGQTEANLLTGNCAVVMPAKPGSMGRPIPGHDVAVLNEEGRELPVGEPGVLAAKKPDPIFFLEYWRNPEGTEKKYQGEWLLTGDVGYRDEEGYFFFQGRDDDIISSGAYRIGPTEIEDCIMKHPSVAVVAVIGSPDPIRGEIVKAVVIPKPGVEPDGALVADIQAHVRTRLAAYEYPREIEFVSEMPMTTSGKILRRELRAADRAKKLAPAGDSTGGKPSPRQGS